MIHSEIFLSVSLGLVYGLLVWIVTLAPIHKPITGLSIIHHPLGYFPTLISIGGHVLYGLTLGLVTYKLL